MKGWVKLHRKLTEKAFYSKDSEKVHLWVHLLLMANHDGREEMFAGKPIICKSGQFTTGRKQLSEATGIEVNKVERILNYFEKTEQQIEQQKSSTNRLISICNWNEYQESEQPFEQRVNNDRTTSEQRVNNDRTHSKNVKNDKNERMKEDIWEKSTRFIPPTIFEIQEYCLERKNDVAPNKFFNFYEAKNWMIGKNKMKDWKAAVRTWENSNKKNNSNATNQPKFGNENSNNSADRLKEQFARRVEATMGNRNY